MKQELGMIRYKNLNILASYDVYRKITGNSTSIYIVVFHFRLCFSFSQIIFCLALISLPNKFECLKVLDTLIILNDFSLVAFIKLNVAGVNVEKERMQCLCIG